MHRNERGARAVLMRGRYPLYHWPICWCRRPVAMSTSVRRPVNQVITSAIALLFVGRDSNPLPHGHNHVL